LTSSGARSGRPTGRVAAWVDRHVGAVLVAPAVALILLVVIVPLAYSLWVSVVRFDFRVPGNPFVGADNYLSVLRDPIFLPSVLRTVVLVAVVVVVELVLGLVVALAAVRHFVGRRLVIPILILPLFMSPVVVAQVWRLLWDRGTGPVNHLLSFVVPGGVSVNWLGQDPWYWVAIVVTDAWQWAPFMFVVLLAGLVSIPAELYEASSLDGANAWQSFRSITLPLLVPVILVAITFRVIDAFKLFDVIFVLTNGGPGTATYTLSFFLYQQVFPQFRIGEAAAGSWMFLILVALLAMALVRRIQPGAER
jgi:multiple sugar transport system permease protein